MWIFFRNCKISQKIRQRCVALVQLVMTVSECCGININVVVNISVVLIFFDFVPKLLELFGDQTFYIDSIVLSLMSLSSSLYATNLK